MDEDHAVVVVDNDMPPSTDDRADDGGADTGATTSTTSSSTMACRDPPFECTIAEYGMLLNDVSESLRVVEDAFVELYDCARYGELDACRAILDVWSTSSISSSSSSSSTKNDDEDDPPHAPLVSRRDVSGNTPLHVACANGHASVVRLLLSRGYDNRASNDSGNTPLHWASAAGRSDIVGCLLDHHDALYAASHPSSSSSKFENDDTTTTTGATTCDAANGGRIDVLRKNAFGRSALTEGFASGDARTIERLLNHDSAEEERLIGGLGGRGAEVEGEMEAGEGGGAAGGGRKYDDDGRGDGTGRKSGDVDIDVDVDDDIVRGKKEDGKERNDNGIIHEFDFVSEGEGRRGNAKEEGDDDDDVGGRSASVLIRELPIANADDPFGRSPIEDTTGLGIWCASIVMSRWMASSDMVRRMGGKSIIELGAGCGTPSITAAVYGEPRSVIISDLNPDTIDNARHNIRLNRLDRADDDDKMNATSVTAASIDWADETTYPIANGKFDYVICSDCIYQKDIAHLLMRVVTGLLDPDRGTFLYVAPEGGRDGLDEFISEMKSDGGFECISDVIAPDRYRENPLRSGDEEDFFLHFHELASKAYVLYEFRRR